MPVSTPPEAREFISGMRRLGAERVGLAVLAALPKVRWRSAQPPGTKPHTMPHDARFWSGSADGFLFTVCDFDISDQGFPPGTRGADGGATGQGTIVHLGHPLAGWIVKTLIEAQAGPRS